MAPLRMMLTMGLVVLGQKLDHTDPTVLNGARTLYVLTQIVALSALYYCQNVVEQKKQVQSPIWVHTEEAKAKHMAKGGIMSMLQSAMSGGSGESSAQTPESEIDPQDYKKSNYYEADMEKLSKDMNQAFMGLVVLMGLHVYMGMFLPLILQIPTAIFNLLDNTVIQRHLLGKTVEKPYGELLEDPNTLAQKQKEAVKDTKGGDEIANTSNTPYSEEIEEAICRTWERSDLVDPEAIDTLVKGKGHTIDFKTRKEGWTILMVACGSPQNPKNLIKKLVELGADKSVADEDGWTALHWACYHDCPEAINGLLEDASQDEVRRLLFALTKEGKTCVTLAREHDSTSCAEVLQKYVDVCSIDDNNEASTTSEGNGAGKTDTPLESNGQNNETDNADDQTHENQ